MDAKCMVEFLPKLLQVVVMGASCQNIVLAKSIKVRPALTMVELNISLAVATIHLCY
jgi:hypothetical protein